MQEIIQIVADYCENRLNYTQFSYKITPFIFSAIDGKIKNQILTKKLLSTMEILDQYINFEITTEQKLKTNLKFLFLEENNAL
jgi:hypothetical protein